METCPNHRSRGVVEMDDLNTPIEVIKLYRDHRKATWGIPIGEGRYYYLSDELLENIVNHKSLYDFFERDFDITLPAGIFDTMIKYKHYNLRDYFLVPIPSSIRTVWE